MYRRLSQYEEANELSSLDQFCVFPNDYKVTGKLGAGAQGTCVKIKHRGESLCLKTIPFNGIQGRESAIRQALVEANAMRAVQGSCYFPRLYGVTQNKNEACIAMSLEGGAFKEKRTLQQILEDDCVIPDGKDWCRFFLVVLKDVTEGLELLHSKGRVHGDVKCDNIVVTSCRGNAKLIDLGMSDLIHKQVPLKLADSSADWYPAEVIEGKEPISPYSDVWGLIKIAFDLQSWSCALTRSKAFKRLTRHYIHKTTVGHLPGTWQVKELLRLTEEELLEMAN